MLTKHILMRLTFISSELQRGRGDVAESMLNELIKALALEIANTKISQTIKLSHEYPNKST